MRFGFAVLAILAMSTPALAQGNEQERLRLLLSMDKSATRDLTARAEAGDPFSMGLLGEAWGLAFGGLSQSDTEAARWLERAANAGQSWARREGDFFAFRASNADRIAAVGDTLDRAREALEQQDTAETADNNLEHLANAGNTDAQVLLGRQFETGHGAPEDPAAAARWFSEAARGGDAEGDAELGILFQAGRGVPEDPAAALTHFRKAAEGGSPKGQFLFAAILAHGLDGAERNPVEALKWLALSASGGNVDAKDAFNGLASIIGSDAVAEAARRAVEWRNAQAGRR